MNTKQNGFDNLSFGLAVFCLLLLVIVILSKSTVNPELATFWLMNQNQTLLGVWDQYWTYTGGWYRPTAFHLYYYVINTIIGIEWKSILGFQIITLLLATLNAFLIARLARSIFNVSLGGQSVAFIFALTNHCGYIILYESTGFDFLYQIFSTLFLLALIRSVSDFHSSTLDTGLHCAITLFYFVLAITSKEQAIVITFFPLIVLVFYFKAVKSLPFVKKLFLISSVLTIFLTAGIWVVNVALKASERSGGYRITPVFQVFVENLWRFMQWSLRLNFVTMKDYFDYHNSLVYNISPIIVLLIVLFGFWKRIPYQQNKIFLLLLCAILSAIFPILFGGAPWHFLYANNLIGVVLAVIFYDFFCRRAMISSYAARLTYSTIILVILVSSITSLTAERDGARSFFTRIIPQTIEESRLVNVRPSEVLFSTGEYEMNLWPWSNGDLFRYIFNDPNLPVRHLGVATSCAKELSTPNLVCFDKVIGNFKNNSIALFRPGP